MASTSSLSLSITLPLSLSLVVFVSQRILSAFNATQLAWLFMLLKSSSNNTRTAQLIDATSRCKADTVMGRSGAGNAGMYQG